MCMSILTKYSKHNFTKQKTDGRLSERVSERERERAKKCATIGRYVDSGFLLDRTYHLVCKTQMHTYTQMYARTHVHESMLRRFFESGLGHMRIDCVHEQTSRRSPWRRTTPSIRIGDEWAQIRSTVNERNNVDWHTDKHNEWDRRMRKHPKPRVG